jgi:DNA repair exonuclease SbcCD ATPase subunit
MLPAAQNAVPSQSAPMGSLNALRSHKASLATSVAPASGSATMQEVNLLKLKLKASQLQDDQRRSELKKLEARVKQSEALSAEFTALKDLVERQREAATKGPSPEDTETRLSSLENAKPEVEKTQFVKLQSEVQTIMAGFKQLSQIPEQLEKLHATVTRHGEEIAKAASSNDKLKTELDGLTSIREDVRAIQKQQAQAPALRSDSFKKLIKAATQPDIEALKAAQTEHEETIKQLSGRVGGSQQAIKDVSTRVEANQKAIKTTSAALEASRRIIDDLRAQNLPAQLTVLRDRLKQVEDNEGRTFRKAENLEGAVTRLRKNQGDMDKDIDEFIGKISRGFEDTDKTIIERIEDLEEGKDRIADHTTKHPINSKDFHQLEDIVSGLASDSEKLVKDLEGLKVGISELQHKVQSHTAQGIQTGLSSEEHKTLSDRIGKIEFVMTKSASPTPGANLSQLQESLERLTENYTKLKKNAQKVHESQKTFQAEQETNISQIKKSQNGLQVQQDATTDQIKVFEREQIRLSDRHNTIVGQLQESDNERRKLSEDHNGIAKRFETLEAKLTQGHNLLAVQINKHRDEQASLTNKQKDYQSEQDRPPKNQAKLKALESLESPVTALDKSVDKNKVVATDLFNAHQELRSRVTALETASVSAANQSQLLVSDDADAIASSSRIDGLENRLRSMEDHIGGAGGLSTRCDQLQGAIGEVNEELGGCQNNVDLLGKSIVGLFGEIFDPFKASVEESFNKYDSNFTQTNEALARLQAQIEGSRKECPAATFSAPQLDLIQNMVQGATEVKQDLSRLQEYLHMESEQRNAAVEDLKQQVAVKQDAATAIKAIDVVKHAVQSLQHQYDNISTDDLHQRMVTWFMQSYAHPSANLLQHVPAIQHELAQLRAFTNVVTQVPNSAQTLSALAQLEPQLRTLAQIGPQLKALAQSPLAQTSGSLKTMEDSVAKAHQQHDSLVKVVSNLQTSMHSFNSNSTPFAKADSLKALENSIATLRAELKASNAEGLQARTEFETKASREHEQRVHVETSLRASIQDVAQKVEKEVRERQEAAQEILSTSNKTFKEFDKGQTQLQKALDQLRSDLDKALNDFNDFNDPGLRDALGYLSTLFVHVGQLQWVLEDLNQNLPKGGLEIDWNFDWKEQFPPRSPFPGADGATGDKGKAKKQA